MQGEIEDKWGANSIKFSKCGKDHGAVEEISEDEAEDHLQDAIRKNLLYLVIKIIRQFIFF